MARFVREIMNPELLSVRPGADDATTLDAILEFGITAVPVLDEGQRPVGVTSLRDLVRKVHGRPGSAPASAISSPALTVSSNESVEQAARIMAESGRHHLLVVGGDGRAVGIVSSLDLLRAVIGLPAKHPATFPHFDAALGVSWSDLTELDAAHIAGVPDEPGVLVLATEGANKSERVRWVESCPSLRGRLLEMIEGPTAEREESLARTLERPDVRFRCARGGDVALRDLVARRIQTRIDHTPPPVEPERRAF